MDVSSSEDVQQALDPAKQEKSKVHCGSNCAPCMQLPLIQPKLECCHVQACLSERNVVELVSKLQALGLLSDDLLRSINGQEFITADHLRQEVAGAVDSAGGRIAIVSIPDSLSTDSCVVPA